MVNQILLPNAQAIIAAFIKTLVPLSCNSDITQEECDRLFSYVLLTISTMTEHDWVITSHVRDSFSHKHGSSWDIIPDGTKFPALSVDNHAMGSDPMFQRRETLLRAIMPLTLLTLPQTTTNRICCIVALEANHIHVGFYVSTVPQYQMRMIPVWIKDDVYGDTDLRWEVTFKPQTYTNQQVS